MAEKVKSGMSTGLNGTQVGGPGGSLIRASQVAREAEVRRSPNGVRFATFGETGVPAPDLDRMLEAVPGKIVQSLRGNTYYFVPLALREGPPAGDAGRAEAEAEEVELKSRTRQAESPEQAMVARDYSDDLGDAAICHRNVELGSGHRGVFISTRLMGDRFALSFEFFINVAHAFVDEAGVPARFAQLAWRQAVEGARGETSLDAWEARNLALGRPANAEPEPLPAPPRRNRSFGAQLRPFGAAAARPAALNPVVAEAVVFKPGVPLREQAADPKEQELFLETAFSDAIAIYLLSLALDLDYSELRERDYPLLAPGALAERLRLIAELYPPNEGYEFAVRYRRRA